MLARAVALVNRSCTRQHTEREGVAVVSALHRSMCDNIIATWAFLPEGHTVLSLLLPNSPALQPPRPRGPHAACYLLMGADKLSSTAHSRGINIPPKI